MTAIFPDRPVMHFEILADARDADGTLTHRVEVIEHGPTHTVSVFTPDGSTCEHFLDAIEAMLYGAAYVTRLTRQGVTWTHNYCLPPAY